MTIAIVFIAEHTPADDAPLIVAEFASIGLAAELQFVPPRRSLSDVVWFILVTLPLQHFFSRLAEDAADDAHERLKSFANRLLRRQPTGSPKPILVLKDTRTGVQVVLESDLPAESYRQLLSFDMATGRHGILRYDRQSRRWRSELDEQTTTSPKSREARD